LRDLNGLLNQRFAKLGTSKSRPDEQTLNLARAQQGKRTQS
jgi:hypothetical protein